MFEQSHISVRSSKKLACSKVDISFQSRLILSNKFIIYDFQFNSFRKTTQFLIAVNN